MKKLLYILLLVPVLVVAQSTDQNFVKTTVYKQATTTTVTNPDITTANVQVNYFDGLGRPIQQIAYKQSNSGKDIVTYVEYDQFGRQIKEFLPYVSSGASLNYLPSAQADLLSFYASPSFTNTGNPDFEATGNPYSEKAIENSPLNRVYKQAAPGNDWVMGNGKEIKFEYSTNTDSGIEAVKLFKANSIWNSSLQIYDVSISQNSNYSANQLYLTITKDENWKTSDNKNHTTEEFKDKSGKVVLKRTYNNNVAHDTYYVYDQFGNLSCVLPPLSDKTLSQTDLDNLCYQYKYDSHNRLAAKKIPGKQWEFIVYDKLDRLVATGPVFTPYGGNTVGWIVTEYDDLGRVLQTGWKKMSVSEIDRKNYQESINNSSNPFVLNPKEILTKNFYDNYDFALAPSPLPSPIENQVLATTVKGLSTGSWVRVLDDPESNNAEISYTLYDYKYRPVQTKTTNYLGGYTQVDSNLDWAGKTIYTITKHKRTNSDTELVVKDMFEYSPQDKLILHKQQINNFDEELITKNTYDELGQLISKNVGGVDVTGAVGLQKVDFLYNIRGWLKSINDIDNISQDNDFFAFKINYNQPESANALYNGNISETFWKTATDNVLRKYEYQYDHLNRLLEGNYSRENGTFLDSYFEKLTYDANGNIQSLIRHGDSDANDYEFIIDQLEYTYDSNNKNQLLKVFDSTNSPQGFKDDSNGLVDAENDYEYDLNGNMIKDFNKQIDNITHNHLNLPTQINFANGAYISYLYNATGQKIQKTVRGSDSIVTDYLGGFQYHNGVLKNFPHAEGYVTVVGEKMKYIYNYTDHLGNIRLSYSDADGDNVLGQNEIIEENNYYPFGLKHTAYNTNESQYVADQELNDIILNLMPKFAGDGNYNYKYNGKEYQDELGLNMYDYGARNYDASIGRFSTYDPLAEKTSEPYSYCYNNPVNVIDPTGMSGEDWIKRGSTIFFDPNVKSQADAGTYGSDAVHMPEGSTTTAPDGSYQYTYHNNGTITDKEGNQVDAGKGFTTPGGTTVVGTNSIFGNLWKSFFSLTSTNPVEQYRANRDNPGYNAGEGKYDRIFRLMNSSHAENMLDFGGGGHNMFGGYGRVAGVANNVERAVIGSGDLLRIENASTRINRPITVVGSRANGTAGAFSDWDYVIQGINSKDYSKIKNSIPGARSSIDNTPRNFDIFKGNVDPTKPSITIYPRTK